MLGRLPIRHGSTAVVGGWSHVLLLRAKKRKNTKTVTCKPSWNKWTPSCGAPWPLKGKKNDFSLVYSLILASNACNSPRLVISTGVKHPFLSGPRKPFALRACQKASTPAPVSPLWTTDKKQKLWNGSNETGQWKRKVSIIFSATACCEHDPSNLKFQTFGKPRKKQFWGRCWAKIGFGNVQADV